VAALTYVKSTKCRAGFQKIIRGNRGGKVINSGAPEILRKPELTGLFAILVQQAIFAQLHVK
jgi:hypothetical protein